MRLRPKPEPNGRRDCYRGGQEVRLPPGPRHSFADETGGLVQCRENPARVYGGIAVKTSTQIKDKARNLCSSLAQYRYSCRPGSFLWLVSMPSLRAGYESACSGCFWVGLMPARSNSDNPFNFRLH